MSFSENCERLIDLISLLRQQKQMISIYYIMANLEDTHDI